MYTVNFPSRIQNVRNNKNGGTSENFLATQAGERYTACVYLGHIHMDCYQSQQTKNHTYYNFSSILLPQISEQLLC